MATESKIGGYNDRSALNRATRCSQTMIEIGQRLASECPPELLPLIGKLGYLLASQRDALAEMEQIRSVKQRRTKDD